MRRYRTLGLVGAGCLVVAGVSAWLLLAPIRTDPERYDALRVGMTRADVESVLGGRPGNRCAERADVWVPKDDGKRRSAELPAWAVDRRFLPDPEPGGEECVWVTEEGLIAARFGADGRLQEKYYSDVHLPGAPLAVRVARWFR